jgi:AbrB family transcriptional regulator (stage V sporulation protein T)
MPKGERMKALGIVRRIDELGRIVIPKEIRRTLRIREGDPLEIFTDREGELILKKYSPLKELHDFADEYAEALNSSANHSVAISDRDTIIAYSGENKKDYINKPLSIDVEKIIEGRVSVLINKSEGGTIHNLKSEDKADYVSELIVPISVAGDRVGAVIMFSKDKNAKMGELETKLLQTAANFLAKLLE